MGNNKSVKTRVCIIATLICGFVPSASQAAAVYFGGYAGVTSGSDYLRDECDAMNDEKAHNLGLYGYYEDTGNGSWPMLGYGAGLTLGLELGRVVCAVDGFGERINKSYSYKTDADEYTHYFEISANNLRAGFSAGLIVWRGFGFETLVWAGYTYSRITFKDYLSDNKNKPSAEVLRATDIDNRYVQTQGYYFSVMFRPDLTENLKAMGGPLLEIACAPDYKNEHPSKFALKLGVYRQLDF